MIEELKKYVKKNGASGIASALKYRDSSTILQWIRRRSIPEYQIENLKKIIRKGNQNDKD